jgi:phage terminase large subunit GpA-like protein
MTNALQPMQTTDAEKNIFVPPQRIGIDLWMETSYRLPEKTSDVTGLYSFDYTPFFREPMQRLSEPPVKVGIESCTQAGKSTLMVGVFGYLVDCDPGPTLFVMPRQTDVERRINTRVRPMFEVNPDLLKHVPCGDLRNINIGKETVFDTMIAFLAWSTSPAALADNPICNALIDEPGKFEELRATGENPFDLIDERLRTFWMRSRTFYVTSPQDEDDLSDKQFRSGSDERWHVPCMLCGLWHEIGARQDTLILSKNDDGKFFPPEAYHEGQAESWYQCPHCKGRWTELRRAKSIAAGQWIARGQTLRPDGTIVGQRPQIRHFTYRINSMMMHPRFWQVHREAAKFVAALEEKKAGSLMGLRNYIRNQQATPWKEVSRTISDDALSARVIDLDRRCVPVDAKLLVAAADYHEDFDGNIRIDFEVRAFGQDLINWVVLAGSLATWNELELALMSPFPWAGETDQEELNVLTVFIDSGDKTDAVYAWCGQFLGWAWPIKGVENQRTPLVLSNLERVHEQRERRHKRRMSSAKITGQQLVLVDQSVFSEMITSWTEPDKQTAGSTFFYKQILEDTNGAYFKEFGGMNRVQISRGSHRIWTWRPKGKHTPVHFHDTARYASAAAWFNKAHLMRSAVDPTIPPAMIKLRNNNRSYRKYGQMERN